MQEPIVSLLRRSTIKRNLEITIYYVHFVLVHGSFVAVVIWKILLVQVDLIYSPREADLARAFLIAIACSLASALASASPRAPATLRYLARLRAAISSAAKVSSLMDLSDLRRFL